MRSFAVGLFLLVASNVKGQTYSSIVKDSQISNFITSLIKTSHQGHKLFINNHIMSLEISDLSSPILKEFFDKADSNFFVKQIQAIQKDSWDQRLGQNKLIIKTPEGSNPGFTIFSFSMPLFSVDQRKAVVTESFYCGLLCGGGAYYICELQKDGTWKKVKKFNEWAE